MGLEYCEQVGTEAGCRKQLKLLQRRKIELPEGITSGQASMILNRIMNRRKVG